MRLHALEVTAFGPFADTARVDFDQLSDAGLFLLSGATGAGKSSILDAVCFALYGDVPGDRSAAKRLRCDQAAEGEAPRVRLEATLAGRRFRIERSPAWERPKKRGSGSTTEPAHVVISELDPGGWRPVSTRLDETGHLVTRLVGMNLVQFCQVAMLPQGRFQAFLRARSEERHALLQQVFRTARFDQIERWLRDHRIALRRTSDTHHRRVADLVSRVSEAADVGLPDGWDVAALTPPAADPDLLGWVHELHTVVTDRTDEAATVLRSAGRDEHDTRERLTAAREVADRLARHHAATAELGVLLDAVADHQQDRRALARARRAESLRPLVDGADRAERLLADARAAAARALAATWATLDVSPVRDDAALAALERHRRDSVTAQDRVHRALPLAPRVTRLETAEASLCDRLAGSERELAEVDARARRMPTEVREARARRDEATAAAAALPGARVASAALTRAMAAAAEVLTVQPAVEQARREHAQSVTVLLAAKDAWLAVREARLDGMAAEIAGKLAVGACCPVCGSADHPSPASPHLGAPDAAAEKAARKEVDDLEVLAQAHDERVRDLETRLAVARATAGDDVSSLPRRQRQAQAELDALEVRAGHAPGLERRLKALEDEEAGLAGRRAEAQAAVAALSAELTRVRDEHDRATREIGEVLDGSGCEDLLSLADLLAARERACTEALAALSRLDRAREAGESAAASLEEAAVRADLASAEAARAALRAPSEVAVIEERIDAHVRAVERVRGVLEDPELRELEGVDAPDVAGLEAALEVATATATAARRRHDLLAARGARLGRLVTDVAGALDAWAPVRDELGEVTALAALVEGKSADNHLQMRLSAYVLAHRLAQVVDAANLRLATMSDQRYSLEHTGRRGAGESRGGLSLLVRDDWSGEGRDPATLSGGETFVVSLALALGLADVITQEAGGADLDTLFVDEGFGSLDADTLDDVMDTLDSLRDGGRVVGVVSHVAELQTRIPTQLRVLKHRSGSRVEAQVG